MSSDTETAGGSFASNTDTATMPRRLVLKTETDRMPASKVLCMTLFDINSCDIYDFNDDRFTANHCIDAGIVMLARADAVITHSAFHLQTLQRLYDLEIDPSKVIDTLKLAQTRWERGNSLTQLAARLGYERTPFAGANEWSEAVQRRCRQDAYLVAAVYQHLTKEIGE